MSDHLTTPDPGAPAPTCPACGGEDWTRLETVTDRGHGIPGEFRLLQCAECGVVTYEPALADEELGRYYPADYYAYAIEPPPGPGWRGRLRRTLDDLQLGRWKGPSSWPARVAFAPLLWYKEVYGYARHLRGVPRGRLLDIGCGAGGFLVKARAMGFTAEGVEPGVPQLPAMTSHGIVVTDNDHPHDGDELTVRIHSCRVEEFDPGERRYDVITLNHVFEHVRDPAELWGRIDRWLTPGGRVLVRMPDTNSLAFRRYRRFWYGLEVPRHLWLFDERNFSQFLARRGYRISSFHGECVPLHWQYSIKRLLTGHLYSEPSILDHAVFSLPLLPMVALFNFFGWSDMMAAWVERDTARG